MDRYVAAQRPAACPNASVPADRQSTGCRVERGTLSPLILGQPARRRQRPSARLSARCSERVAFAPPLPRKLAPSRTVGVGWRKASKLCITEIKSKRLVSTGRLKGACVDLRSRHFHASPILPLAAVKLCCTNTASLT